MCALNAVLSICRVFEHIGHVCDCTSLSGFGAGVDREVGFTAELGFEEEAIRNEGAKDVGLEEDGLELELGFDEDLGLPSVDISSSSMSSSRFASSSSSSYPGIETSKPSCDNLGESSLSPSLTSTSNFLFLRGEVDSLADSKN